MADEIAWSEPTFIKGHKKTITDFHLSNDGINAFSVSKDCCILKWDITTGTKEVFSYGEKYNTETGGHTDEILSCALSKDD